MVRFWVALVQSGKKTLDEVPEKYRDAVEAALNEE